ncbi:MAG: hypothetical protein HF975_04275 [ANME-2 cluster archaeon]|nr:hypothetical protein [ANME-2 cluster archaeon]
MTIADDTEFYNKVVSLTTHISQELDVLHKLRTDYQDTDIDTKNDIRNINTMGPMLSDLTMLATSIDVIAKFTLQHINEDKEDDRE